MKHSSKKIRRPPDSKLKKYRPCIHSKILSAAQPLNPCYKTSHQTPLGWGTVLRAGVLCVPFAWQSDKPILLYFTDWKRSVFIPIPKNGNAKGCSNYCTITLISHASKVMLKIL